jgi:hypothetical protein
VNTWCAAASPPSAIVGDKTIKGPADKMMRRLGHEVSALSIARFCREDRAMLTAFIQFNLFMLNHQAIRSQRNFSTSF